MSHGTSRRYHVSPNIVRYSAIQLSVVGNDSKSALRKRGRKSTWLSLLLTVTHYFEIVLATPALNTRQTSRAADIGKRYQRHHRAIQSRAICHQIPVTINIFSFPAVEIARPDLHPSGCAEMFYIAKSMLPSRPPSVTIQNRRSPSWQCGGCSYDLFR